MKYEFASRPWFAALHATICEKAAVAARTEPGFTYRICEVFTGVPEHLSSGGRIAWHAIVHGGRVQFALNEIPEADMKAVADYASVLPLANYDTKDLPERAAELQAKSQALIAAGRLTITGSSLAASANPMSSLHDSMARLTK